MPDFSSLWAVAAAFFVAAASPGPATLAVAAVSMRHGRRAGLRYGLGLSVGLAFWGVIAASGLGALLRASGDALTVLKILGGAYLLWLAIASARAAMGDQSDPGPATGDGRAFTRGLVLNLSNPKAVFAWMATLALGLGHQSGTGQVIVASLVCMGLGCAIYCAYALAFSGTTAMQAYARARRWIESAVAGLFAMAGFALLRSAFSAK